MINFEFRLVIKVIIYIWITIHFIVIHHSFNEYFVFDFNLSSKNVIYKGVEEYNRYTGNPYPYLSYEGFIGDRKYFLYFNDKQKFTKLFIKLNDEEYKRFKDLEHSKKRPNIKIFYKDNFIWQIKLGDSFLRNNFEEYIEKEKYISYIVMTLYFALLLIFFRHLYYQIKYYLYI